MSFNGLPESNQSKPRQRRFLDHLQSMPLGGQLAAGEVRSQRHRIPSYQWPRERAMHPVSRKQQLQPANCTHRLRQFRMPSDHLAANDDACALFGRPAVCLGKLRELPHDEGLGRCLV